jgi:hypothetical protein
MALSASRLAWMTKSIEADNTAAHYKSLAICGIRRAISDFSCENADAILAASILLSLQLYEW